MKEAMKTTAQPNLATMFSSSTDKLQKNISKSVEDTSAAIVHASVLLQQKLEGILSLSWDTERAKGASVNSELIPEIGRLIASQQEAIKLLAVDEDGKETEQAVQKEDSGVSMADMMDNAHMEKRQENGSPATDVIELD